MSVCFVSPLHSSRTRGYSIERYAFELQDGLSKRGLRTVCIDSGSLLEGAERNRVGRVAGVVYEGAKMLASLREVSLVHFADPVIGLVGTLAKGVPVVTTVHEVPDRVSHGALVGVGLRILDWSCANSDALIADSLVTKEDLVRKLQVPEEKISVVNLGVDPRFVPKPARERRRRTIGYVGAYYPRKNVRFLLEAYGMLCADHPDLDVELELWGRTAEYKERMTSLIDSLRLKNVHLRGFANDDLLPQVYNSFDVFVFPSLKEGFGLPILEAKRCGIPTVLLRGARISPEVASGSILSSTRSELSGELYELLSNQEYAEKVALRGLEESERFTWDRTVEGVLQVYRRLGLNQRKR